MALWLIRAGRHGQQEQQFLDDNRVCLGWGGVNADLRMISTRDQLRALLRDRIPDAKERKLINGVHQIWAFTREMRVGDWFVLPSKMKREIHIGEICGGLEFGDINGDPTNYRQVKWLQKNIPRANFDQDLLYSFGALMTICRVQRNDAERRIRAMATCGWSTLQSPGATIRNTNDS